MALLYTNRHLLNHLTQLKTSNDNSNNNAHILHWHYTEYDDKNFQIHGRTLFYLFILFSIILLITLLLLYARWFFRFRHLHHHSQNSHAPHVPPTCNKGLDVCVIKAMPIILHQGSVIEREDEMECCICLGVFEDGDKVKVLHECKHRFHSDCVDLWLIGQASCPLCRVSLLKPPLPSTDLKLAIV